MMDRIRVYVEIVRTGRTQVWHPHRENEELEIYEVGERVVQGPDHILFQFEHGYLDLGDLLLRVRIYRWMIRDGTELVRIDRFETG